MQTNHDYTQKKKKKRKKVELHIQVVTAMRLYKAFKKAL